MRGHENRHDHDERIDALANHGEELVVEFAIRLVRDALPPQIKKRIDDFDSQVSQRARYDQDQRPRQIRLQHLRPLKETQANVKKDDEHDNFDRPAQQIEQDVVELGFGFGGQFLEPDASNPIKQLGDREREQDINQRRDIFPNRVTEKAVVIQCRDTIQAEAKIFLVELLRRDQCGLIRG